MARLTLDHAADAGAPSLGDGRRIVSVSFLKRLFAAMGEHHLSAYAAGLAYGAVFAIVPTLALLVLLLGLFNATDLVERAIGQLHAVLPADVTALVATQLRSVAHTSDSGTFGVGVVVSAAVALWGASGAIRRVMEALNVVHGVDETRPFVKKTGLSLILAAGAIVFVAVSLVVIVVGGTAATRIFDVIGLGSTAADVWTWVRWPVLLAIAWLGIAMLYRFAPAARQAGGIATPGTIFATFGWVIFSGVFSWYVSSLGNFSASWGAVAGVVVLLLYVQYAGLIILLGALIDVLLFDEARPQSRVRRLLHVSASK